MGLILIAEEEDSFKNLVEEIRTLIRIQEPTIMQFIAALNAANKLDRKRSVKV